MVDQWSVFVTVLQHSGMNCL